MEIRYIRDADHNYLVMAAGHKGSIHPEKRMLRETEPNTAGQDKGGYERVFAEKMLQAHTPEGMIGFEIRIRNHEPLLFYKIDSLVSLSNRTLTSKLSRQEMHELLHALCLAQEALTEYLIDEENLFLSLDTVFANPSTHQWFFLCYPYAHDDEGSLALFLEELTGVISTADDDAVSEVYALYEMAGRKNVHLRDMLKELRQTYDVDEDCSAAACHPSDYGETQENEQKQIRVAEQKSYVNHFEYGTEERKKTPKNSLRYGENRDNGDNGDKSYLITTLLFIVVMLIPVYIRKEYVLSEAANTACSVIMGLCAAGAVGSLLLERRAKKSEYGEEDDEDDEDEDEVENVEGYDNSISNTCAEKQAEKGILSYPDKEKMGRSFMHYLNDDGRSRKSFTGQISKPYNPYSRMFERKAEVSDDCTVLLNESEQQRIPKLYGRNQAASKNILLEQLPLTLGSLGGSVDYKLSDKSISRMHAYIGKNESGSIFLKDLGSTNGTYLNGRRLNTNEVTYLNRGDEVRFGALEFEFI